MLNLKAEPMPRAWLILELLVAFVALPLAYRFVPLRLPPLPVLWAVSACALWQLLRNPRFERSKLWNWDQLPSHFLVITANFACAALLIWLGVRWFAPELQWSLPRHRPLLWAIVMVAYPVLSVYPQALLYRAFFFERYRTLFPASWAIILASAAVFSLMHIIFRNPLALALTFLGGLLFAYRYAETGSLAASSFEQALYGCWLFTVGLDRYLYSGTVAATSQIIRQ
jgi:uncharacterized protein